VNQVANVLGGIGAFQQSVDFASATVDSAGFNQQAAMSNLSDTDFADASSQLSLANVQQNSVIALAAQGNLLNPALLKLVS
jgi:flagellin-like hook-associated protein FlgL